MDIERLKEFKINGWIVNLQGKDFVTHAGLLDIAHKSGLSEIQTEIIKDTPEMVVFKATIKMERDGKIQIFTGYGDATPENVNSLIRKHILRMAETRAVNRGLRFATNIGMCSIDELGGDEEDKPKPTPKKNERDKYTCVHCGIDCAEIVKNYSIKHYNKILCRDCQKKPGATQEEFISDELE